MKLRFVIIIVFTLIAQACAMERGSNYQEILCEAIRQRDPATVGLLLNGVISDEATIRAGLQCVLALPDEKSRLSKKEIIKTLLEKALQKFPSQSLSLQNNVSNPVRSTEQIENRKRKRTDDQSTEEVIEEGTITTEINAGENLPVINEQVIDEAMSLLFPNDVVLPLSNVDLQQNEALFEAIKNARLAQVRTLLNKANINAKSEEGFTPLEEAIYAGSAEKGRVFSLLLIVYLLTQSADSLRNDEQGKLRIQNLIDWWPQTRETEKTKIRKIFLSLFYPNVNKSTDELTPSQQSRLNDNTMTEQRSNKSRKRKRIQEEVKVIEVIDVDEEVIDVDAEEDIRENKGLQSNTDIESTRDSIVGSVISYLDAQQVCHNEGSATTGYERDNNKEVVGSNTPVQPSNSNYNYITESEKEIMRGSERSNQAFIPEIPKKNTTEQTSTEEYRKFCGHFRINNF